MENVSFHIVDYIVFILTLVFSVSIGIFYAARGSRRKDGKTDTFLLAGRKMSVFPVSVSIFVSWLSAISFLGDPVEVYYHGIVYIYTGIGYALACPIVALYFAPFFYNQKITSAYEFIATRYHNVLRYVACIVVTLCTMLYLGVVVYGPSVALSQVTGIQEWISILIIGIVGTFYTTLGGMKAVLWVDTFQSVIMLAGLIALLVFGSIEAGGPAHVWNTAHDYDRLNFLKQSINPLVRSTVVGYLVSGFFRVFVPYISVQHFIQRYSTLRNDKDAARVVYLNIPMFVVVTLLFGMTGLVMFAYYTGCDPLVEGRISTPNQLIPLFMLDVLGFLPGVPGIFLACLFSASLSTFSSAVNAIAANILVDIVRPCYNRFSFQRLGDTGSLWIAKLVSFITGLLVIGLSFLVLYGDASVFTLTVKITGIFSSPIGALFFMGRVFKFVDSVSACVGALFGLAVSVWWGIGAIIYPPPSQALALAPTVCENIASNTSLLNSSYITSYTTTIDLSTTASAFDNSTLFPTDSAGLMFKMTDIYGISPLWFSALGFIITVIIAVFIASIRVCIQHTCCRRKYKQQYYMAELIPNDTIPYQEGYGRNRHSVVL